MRLPPLPLVGLVVGLWAFLPVYTGPELNVAQRVEIADHLIPGLVVLAACAAAMALRLRATMLLVAGMAVALAGFWMTATHLPLVVQATDGQVPWTSAIYHTLPGLAVLGVGLVWILRPEPPPESP